MGFFSLPVPKAIYHINILSFIHLFTQMRLNNYERNIGRLFIYVYFGEMRSING